MNSKNNTEFLIILPHWSTGGGAGFYIQNLIENLESYITVKVSGNYAKDYSQEPIQSNFLNKLGSLSLPVYEGIRPTATLVHFFLSLVRMLSLFVFNHKDLHAIPTAFVFTSSIQAMSVPIVKWFYPSSKIVIAVQEQIDLSRLFGKLILRFLRQSDVVLAITEDWATHARKFGIRTLLVRNQYDGSYAASENNQTPAIESDLLYVGGGAKIKGFDNFESILPELLTRPGLRIICLGHYSKNTLSTLEKIRTIVNSGAELIVIGNVPDIRPYLRGTKLLFLPIGSPHFCRPAIEAGFFSKTFVIPNYDGLDEFSVDNFNCKKYDKFDTKQSLKLIDCMLNSPQNLDQLGQGNLQVALNYQRSDNTSMHQLMKLLIADIN
jgi:hypothetical protein